MKRVAIYARYSTDLQSARSIDDQFRACRDRCDREGWTIHQCYADHAVSGAIMMRPGLQKMLHDGQEGRFDTIVAESLDRLSRDQADIAAIFKHMQFAGIGIFTLSEGRVGILDIGLRGTMNQLYLVETANKVRRGQHGRVKAGKIPSGISYGYDVVRKFDEQGMPVRGERTINETHAKLIRWIFREYGIVGRSAHRIAHALNAAGVPSPTGHEWTASTIAGNPHRGIGILNNEFYIGQLVWRRMGYFVNPETGKRVYRLNPESEWIRESVPWLRIVGQDLWDRVKARQQNMRSPRASAAIRMAKVHYRSHYPKHLLSGLLTCSSCGGGFTIRRHDDYGCAARHARGTCSNQLRIGRQALENKVLDGLKERLASDPERCAAFCEAYSLRLIDLRNERQVGIGALRDELTRLETECCRIREQLEQAPTEFNVNAELERVINQRAVIEGVLARSLELRELDQTLENQYREHVKNLVDTLSSTRRHHDSYESFRSLIGQIVLRPNESGTGLLVELEGGPLRHHRRRKNVRKKVGAQEHSTMERARGPGVAAEGFEPPTKGL
jgi:site-specific DNA recombinase